MNNKILLFILILSIISCGKKEKENITGPDPVDNSPAKLEIIAGDNQTGTINKELSEALTVKIVDSKNNPVENEEVNFTVIKGAADLDKQQLNTDGQGVAKTNVTLGLEVGPIKIEAKSNELDPVMFELNAKEISFETGQLFNFNNYITENYRNAVSDFVIDTLRRNIYLTLHNRNSIAIYSLLDQELKEEIKVGSAPQKLAMSQDGETLYITLNEGGSIVIMNLKDFSFENINVQQYTGSAQIYDVIEDSTGKLFVSASTGMFAYLGVIDITGDKVKGIKTDFMLRSDPLFAINRNKRFLYIGESAVSPNSLYKFDISQGVPKLILEDEHGTVGGTRNIVLDRKRSRIYLASGQVLNTDNFYQIGSVTNGISTLDRKGEKVYVAHEYGVTVHETETFSKIREIDYQTHSNTIRKIAYWPGSQTIFTISGNIMFTYSLK